MSPTLREALRYMTIGLAFGLIWATMQYINGQMRDIAALAGPIVVCGAAGLLMWALRRAFVRFRNR